MKIKCLCYKMMTVIKKNMIKLKLLNQKLKKNNTKSE